MVRSRQKQLKAIFVTGTDTDVGKTVATLVLGALFQKQGLDVGVMKPVQCAGDDAVRLQQALAPQSAAHDVNPYFAPEPLSPHIAFPRDKQAINIARIHKKMSELIGRHDLLLVEGAGGLMVPITAKYLFADLARDMDMDVVIVARTGLGTINHTLLTLEQARSYGLNVRGIIFNQSTPQRGVAEETNPDIIKHIGQVPVLGVIPYLQSTSTENIIKQCSHLDIKKLRASRAPKANKRVWEEMDKRYVWHPFTQMKDWQEDEPLVIESAKGSYLMDTHGRKYLDGVSSLWVNVHGHGHPAIDHAIMRQVKTLSHSTMLGLAHKPSIALAKKLVEIAPKGLKKVFYSDNGSTAVEVGIKMAYQYWQNTGQSKKTRLIHLANSYHGDTLGSVSVGGIDLFHRVYRHLMFETIQLDFPDCYRAPKGKTYPDYAFECLERLEGLLKKKSGHIAAMIVEPIVQGAAGMIMWPKGVLKRMAELCQKHDVLFIADEVATGFGRTGTMFACDQEQVRPDILCLAKGLTAGYLPLAATLATERIFDGFCADYREQKTFFHGHTYTGNPLGCAAALASLEVFEKQRVLEKLAPKIKHLRKGLRMFYNLRHVGDVRQLGFMVGIELVKDKARKTPFSWEEKIGVRVCQRVREQGVILRPLGNVIVLMPPLSMSTKELDHLLAATYEAIEAVTDLEKEKQRMIKQYQEGYRRKPESTKEIKALENNSAVVWEDYS